MYRVFSEEVRGLFGDIMIDMKSLGKLLGGLTHSVRLWFGIASYVVNQAAKGR